MRFGDQRSGHLNDFSPHNWARIFRQVQCGLPLETQPLNRLLSPRAQFVIVRPVIYNHRVAVTNVSDVCRLVDNRHVALGWNYGCLNATRAKLIRRNETILVRANIVVIICPITNTAAPIEARFWRKRGPPDIIVTLAP